MLVDGAQGSTTTDLGGCHASVFVSGALLNHGSGCSGFCGGFDSHGSLNCGAFEAIFPLPLAAPIAAEAEQAFNQSSVDDPDATDGE